MGFVYVGGKTNQSVNGYMKIGETNKTYLSTRIGEIRHAEGNFVCFKYLEIPNSTSAITKAIEGHTRMMLEREGYHNVQNDHFVMPMTKDTKDSIYNAFVDRAIYHMTSYCNMFGIAYELKDAKPNARRNVRRKKQ